MAIDPLSEHLISLNRVPKELPLPSRQSGKHIHGSTTWRWATKGCRGVVLESILVGGTRCTSKEALARFFEALTKQAGNCSAPTPSQCRKAAEDACRQLEREGI